MAEAEKAVQSPEDNSNPSTPQIPADNQTTVTTEGKSGFDNKAVMDILDIPPEVQARLAPKAEEPKAEEKPEEVVSEKQDDSEDEDEDDGEAEKEESKEAKVEEEEPVAAEHPQKVDKRLKRINRLTRKLSEKDVQLDELAAANQKLREQLQTREGQAPENQVPPLIGPELGEIQKELAVQDATLEWCDDNIDGGEIGVDGKTQYYDAKVVRSWRRNAELKRHKLVVAEQKELDRLAGIRQDSDREAFKLWPEMWDKTKPEYQQAVSVLRKYPFITAIPEGNYTLGLLIEADRALKAKNAAAKNGEPKKQHRDLDERVFTTPRVPIAPHTSEPPIRESKASSHKIVNEAMSRLVKDSDGSPESLANVFAALDRTQNARPSSRSPVKS